jgi:hypothetical protein
VIATAPLIAQRGDSAVPARLPAIQLVLPSFDQLSMKFACLSKLAGVRGNGPNGSRGLDQTSEDPSTPWLSLDLLMKPSEPLRACAQPRPHCSTGNTANTRCLRASEERGRVPQLPAGSHGSARTRTASANTGTAPATQQRPLSRSHEPPQRHLSFVRVQRPGKPLQEASESRPLAV